MHITLLLLFVTVIPACLCRFIASTRNGVEEITSSRQRRSRNGGNFRKAFLPGLRIKSAPPDALEIVASENIVLECEAGGNPPPTIHWLKDGNRVSQSLYEDAHSTSQEENTLPLIGLSFTKSRLYVDCAGPKDQGVYTCVAENSFQRKSKNTILTVTDLTETEARRICLAKKSFSSSARIHMWTHTRLELMGSDVQLFCRSDGEPQPKVTWIKPSENVDSTDSEKYQVLENGDLIIRNIDWDDMGEYICEVSNSQGSDSTATFLYPVKPDKNENDA